MAEAVVILTIFGMSVVTMLPRVLPILFLAGRDMPRIVTAWLGFIPVAVLCALLIPDLVIVAGQPALQLENVGLLAAIPTTVAAVRTRNLFLTLLVGMGSMALLRAIV